MCVEDSLPALIFEAIKEPGIGGGGDGAGGLSMTGGSGAHVLLQLGGFLPQSPCQHWASERVGGPCKTRQHMTHDLGGRHREPTTEALAFVPETSTARGFYV